MNKETMRAILDKIKEYDRIMRRRLTDCREFSILKTGRYSMWTPH